MNIQNIMSLTNMLVATGFDENIGRRLAQYICFKPADFFLTEQLVKEENELTCSIFFERKGDDYVCVYYDASFLKKLETPEVPIQGIDLKDLDKRMADTDWWLDGKGNDEFKLGDEKSWHRERKIELIMTDLFRLSATDTGKQLADSLKMKHWSSVPLHPLMGNLNGLRSRFEICQRFYFFNGQSISIDEAYRFLLNRWLEKKLHAKRKLSDEDPGIENTDGSDASGSQTALLKKRKRTVRKHLKR